MEKNISIYNELRAVAERVFNEGMNAPAGIYSLFELAKVGTSSKTAPAGVSFRNDYDKEKEFHINVDGFECCYPAHQAFALAYKFERLASISAKDHAVFQRVADLGEPVASFTVDAVLIDNLAACDDPKKSTRPTMQGVRVDLVAGLACCTNGHALNVSRLFDAQVFKADVLTYSGVTLCRSFIKKAKGSKVVIYQDNAGLRAVASNGASCAEIPGNYPNFKSVFSHVDESAPVRLVKSVRELKKTVAIVAKAAACKLVCVSGYSGDDFITISAQGDDGEVSRRVALAERSPVTFATICDAIKIKGLNNAVNTFFVAQCGWMEFVGKKAIAVLTTHYDDSKATATAAAAASLRERSPFEDKYNFNIFAAFVKATEDSEADTLTAAPVASADSIQATEGDSEADTLDVAPVAPVDSIQAAASRRQKTVTTPTRSPLQPPRRTI